MKKLIFYPLIFILAACGKDKPEPAPNPNPNPQPAAKVNFISATSAGIPLPSSSLTKNVNPARAIYLNFDKKLSAASLPSGINIFKNNAQTPLGLQLINGDSSVQINAATLSYLTAYRIELTTALKSADGAVLANPTSISFNTGIDSTDKFPRISDDELLTKIQQQTFSYFWDYAHSVSGMARERTGSGETVTSGGTGFGIMATIVASSRNFITRAQALQRMQTLVSFLKNTAQTFHGAYPHWLNGTTGAVIPFSANDNGADLVETSFLAEGLICLRQYFDGSSSAETAIRADINTILNRIEWNWFRNNQNVLYWHWSPTVGFAMNMPIKGWNECLITYVMAASSPTNGIPPSVYSQGWASNGSNGFINGNTYYNTVLPLGPTLGGPLFFEHYSFMGINPNGLQDAYANYATQTKNHTLINQKYCIANPQNRFGYSESCWGLTASDIPNGYFASSPTNDLGVIAPTAAISSLPYTPAESMKALKFFYYTLGDKLWKQYGFVDAFSLDQLWFADSHLAIDQGPQIVLIENYRTGLLWNLFTSAPEIKSGMRSLGFTAPYL